ncbi:MAG: two-component system response regulator OmpR [Methylophilaceae bacterium]|nr:two-component system response regulator OmpR [Methylophilaceae bacterium]
MEKHVLVVDDDRRLRDLLTRYLGAQGFIVQSAEDGEAMDRLLAQARFDAIVLDLMLPGEDGLAICRRLRASGGHVPILMLTARGDEVDRIIGLEMGADDYLPKPFNPRELLARLNAILRRRVRDATTSSRPEEGSIVFGEYCLEPGMRRLIRQGEIVPLTSGEYSLLYALATHPNQPMSRQALLDLARGREMEAYDRSIDVQVSRLRKIIETDPSNPRFIQTVWGYGYVFVP